MGKLHLGAIDYDARDVEDYERTHPPSPASDPEMPALVGPKRGQHGEGFSPHKSSKTGVSKQKEEQTVLDNGTVQEPEPKVPRTSPQGSLSFASASQLCAPDHGVYIQNVLEVDEIDDDMWEQDVSGYVELQWVSVHGEHFGGKQLDEGKTLEISQKQWLIAGCDGVP